MIPRGGQSESSCSPGAASSSGRLRSSNSTTSSGSSPSASASSSAASSLEKQRSGADGGLASLRGSPGASPLHRPPGLGSSVS